MMNTALRQTMVSLVAMLATTAVFAQAPAKPKYFQPKPVDLRAPILWGSECEVPDGPSLRFGGIDQKADDGAVHTQIKVDGQWKDISAELRQSNPLQEWLVAARHVDLAERKWYARNRFLHFEGVGEAAREGDVQLAGRYSDVMEAYLAFIEPMTRARLHDAERFNAYALGQMERAAKCLTTRPDRGMASTEYAEAAEFLDCEPAPRCMSPIVYDAKSKLFVLFGGDHLDYLTNDTWVFDPAKKQWQQRHPKTAPPARAGHTLEIVRAEDGPARGGKVKLSGGYTHNNHDIWYMGPLYQLHDDGDWTYDVEANTWTSDAGKTGVEPNGRVYRTFPGLSPESFLKGEKPDAAANEAKLKALPVNTWVRMNPPVKPRLNRDWGSACIATDYDVLLRWSGGHCAHSGSDVPMYHFATNRWEMPFPVEFCLGQTYSNTSYPGGFNLNRRPWVTGHTYKNFGYDPASKTMVFSGHPEWAYIFDPKVADWTGRSEKPKAMQYGGCFYTLTCVTTDKALYCWGGGRDVPTVHVWNAQTKAWEPVKVTGAKLPGPEVDHCGLAFDAKRNRLIFFPRMFKDTLWAMDVKTGEVSELKPGGAVEAARTIGYWREQAYLPDADMILQVGASVDPKATAGATPTTSPDVPRLSLVYDCAKNEFRTFAIGGAHAAGNGGRNVSCGSGYDPKRQLIWATDTGGEIYVLRFDATKAGKD